MPSNVALIDVISKQNGCVIAQPELAWSELSSVSKLTSQELAYKLTDQALSAAPAEV